MSLHPQPSRCLRWRVPYDQPSPSGNAPVRGGRRAIERTRRWPMSETETEAPAPVLTGTPAEIAEGVHVIPDGRVPLVPNVGIVLGDRDALVVDTAMGPRNGATAREHAERL